MNRLAGEEKDHLYYMLQAMSKINCYITSIYSTCNFCVEIASVNSCVNETYFFNNLKIV